MVITSKIIKVKSAGRYTKSTGAAIIGPQRSFYKEKVSEIGYLLQKYPKIMIVERIEDGRFVNLTLANYNTNNNEKSKPVSVETVEAPEAPSEKQEEQQPQTEAAVTTAGVDVSPESLAQYDAMKDESTEPKQETVEAPEAPSEKQEEQQPQTETGQSNQQNAGKNKKNKNNKNDHQQANKSTEVTPEEPVM